MLKAALTIVALTLLLAAHVFTRPYIDIKIDILDFTALCCLIFYAMTGMLMYPSITEKAQGRMCGQGLDTDDDGWCSAENQLKDKIAIAALVVLSAVLGFALWLTWLAVKEIRDSIKAHKRISEELDRQDDEIIAETANQLDLEAILHGTAVCRWVHQVHSLGGSSANFAASVNSFMVVDALVREVKHDVTQYSNTPLANLLRLLCDFPGLLELICSKRGERATRGLLDFVEGMAEFVSETHRVHDHTATQPDPEASTRTTSSAVGGAVREMVHTHFPITEVTKFEHRPLLVYCLLTCSQLERSHFTLLIRSILSSNGIFDDTLRLMLEGGNGSGAGAETADHSASSTDLCGFDNAKDMCGVTEPSQPSTLATVGAEDSHDLQGGAEKLGLGHGRSFVCFRGGGSNSSHNDACVFSVRRGEVRVGPMGAEPAAAALPPNDDDDETREHPHVVPEVVGQSEDNRAPPAREATVADSQEASFSVRREEPPADVSSVWVTSAGGGRGGSEGESEVMMDGLDDAILSRAQDFVGLVDDSGRLWA